MKKLIIILIVSCIVPFSCVDNWSYRFDHDNPEQTVWEIISSNEDYAAFKSLISETGFDSILSRNSTYTVFIPPASTLNSLAEPDSTLKAEIIGYHISNSILYSSDINGFTSLKSLIGKQIFVDISEGQYLLNQGISISNPDILAANGVIHEVDSLLVVRPSLFEILEAEADFSYISESILEGTDLVFDEENSIQTGIDSIGRNIYDSVWISANEFFDNYAKLNSENKIYTLFVADNNILDTEKEGGLKGGFLATFPNYVVEGLVDNNLLNTELTAVNGKTISIVPENVEFYKNASNGVMYKFNKLDGLPIPGPFTWEFTDVSDFDSIRGGSTTDYLNYIDNLVEIQVSALDGGFSEFKYAKKSSALNSDYLSIKTSPGTSAVLEFNLQDILPAKYKISINAIYRVTDGVQYDAFINNELISENNSFNGGTYKFELREIGEMAIDKEQDNVFRMVIDGSSASTIYCLIDYLKFEPVK